MRVLIVEDEADIAHFLGVMFNFYGVEVVTWLADYRLLLAPEHWEGIDVAIVDRMLGYDQPAGEQVLRWLGDHRPGIRRVLLTGAPDPNANGLAHVALTKPAPAQAILHAIGIETNGRR